jgi:hypothetical protein
MLGRMRLIATPLAALLAALAFAVPAFADGAAPIGGPQVITDPSGELDPATGVDPDLDGDADAPPAPVVTDGRETRGTVTSEPVDLPAHATGSGGGNRHDTPSTASSSVPAPSAPAPTPSPAAAATSVPARATKQRETLPFTGVNAGALALIGLALLGTGLAARRQLAL